MPDSASSRATWAVRRTFSARACFVEAEVAVEAVAQVVAVEQERRLAELDQPLLDGRGDRRLAGARAAP